MSTTKGPWRTDGRRVVGMDTHADVDGCTIATCHDHIDQMRFSRLVSIAEAEGNARLIAAAPDLLEALRPFASGYPNNDRRDYIRAVEAITKAERQTK